jgi:hypothetical protein
VRAGPEKVQSGREVQVFCLTESMAYEYFASIELFYCFNGTNGRAAGKSTALMISASQAWQI